MTTLGKFCLWFRVAFSISLSCFFSGGKSAILTALIVGLGGKASATSRGQATKSFVQDGHQYVLNSVFHRKRRLIKAVEGSALPAYSFSYSVIFELAAAFELI